MLSFSGETEASADAVISGDGGRIKGRSRYEKSKVPPRPVLCAVNHAFQIGVSDYTSTAHTAGCDKVGELGNTYSILLLLDVKDACSVVSLSMNDHHSSRDCVLLLSLKRWSGRRISSEEWNACDVGFMAIHRVEPCRF